MGDTSCAVVLEEKGTDPLSRLATSRALPVGAREVSGEGVAQESTRCSKNARICVCVQTGEQECLLLTRTHAQTPPGLKPKSLSNALKFYFVCICRCRCRVPGYTQDTIDELHAKGKWVSCYISVGSVEAWREDAGVFPSSAVGHAIGVDSGENYLDITHEVTRMIPHGFG